MYVCMYVVLCCVYVLCVCVHVDGMNLKYALRWHIHIYQFILCYAVLYTSTHTLKPFEASKPTGLKVDPADLLCATAAT